MMDRIVRILVTKIRSRVAERRVPVWSVSPGVSKRSVWFRERRVLSPVQTARTGRWHAPGPELEPSE